MSTYFYNEFMPVKAYLGEKDHNMQSVYFGKDNSDVRADDHSVTPLTFQTSGSSAEKKERRYYFPDENSGKLKTHAFFSALFGSAVLDLIVFWIVFPAVYEIFHYTVPLIHFVETELIYLVAFTILYIPLSLILYLLIHNAYHRKVYVYDNRTIYVIRMHLRVKTCKKGLFSSEDKANIRIHERYKRYISRIDDYIGNNSFRIKKVLTGCRESSEISDKGTLFTGFNEKKVNDEDISIPSYYFLYDQDSSYYSRHTGQKAALILIKLAVFCTGAAVIAGSGYKKLSIYNRDFASFRDSKITLMEPIGLEYTENHLYDHSYDFLEFLDPSDAYLNNSVKIYFDVESDGLSEGGSFIDYDLYYDDDYSVIKDILSSLYSDEINELCGLDNMIEEYLENPDVKIENTIRNEEYYINISVRESYWADYSVHIYVSCVGLHRFN